MNRTSIWLGMIGGYVICVLLGLYTVEIAATASYFSGLALATHWLIQKVMA
jgi:xanthine/uracil permease